MNPEYTVLIAESMLKTVFHHRLHHTIWTFHFRTGRLHFHPILKIVPHSVGIQFQIILRMLNLFFHRNHFPLIRQVIAKNFPKQIHHPRCLFIFSEFYQHVNIFQGIIQKMRLNLRLHRIIAGVICKAHFLDDLFVQCIDTACGLIIAVDHRTNFIPAAVFLIQFHLFSF